MKKILKENRFFVCICVVMSIYYLYRLFAITPWYDEVYTYLSFIDKGFFFSITHWPLPNNHILFSALSSFLRPAGVYIALRGISYLSAVGTLILLYMFLKKVFGKGVATVGVMLYTVLHSVNVLAIQGRGYSFATFCFMLSIYSVYQIVWNHEKAKRFYILYSLSLFMGLYTLVSSVYWVMVVCACGGLMLLIQKRYKEFWKLVLYALLAAVVTFLAYSIVWLAIGSNMLIDTNELYMQESHVSMILKNPFLCLAKGFQLMANNPYMQGFDSRSVFLNDFVYFGRTILGSFFNVQSSVLWYAFTVIVLALSVLCVVIAVKQFANKEKKDMQGTCFALALSGLGFLVIFFVLFVQCAYPFTRVFSFVGILLAIQAGLFIHWLQQLCERFYKNNRVNVIISGLMAVGCICLLLSPNYNKGYSSLDDNAYDAIEHIEWNGVESYAASDVFINQQIQYHCIMGDNMKLQEDRVAPQIVFVKKDSGLESWSNLIVDFEVYGLDQRAVLYENGDYIVYGKGKQEE
ncbi:MAG: hypothetical protein IKB01_06880 [Lachnospiraceae bacterium]|nr:hypothetical protein [Lachnospiraceae bacterium]MBR3683274.1 hypothetical protein [Lachnospiraceae bacterium]